MTKIEGDNIINFGNIDILEKIIDSIPVAIIIFKQEMFVTCNKSYLDYIDPEIAPFCKPGLSLLGFLDKIHKQMDGVETHEPELDKLHKTDKALWIQQRLQSYRENNTYEVLDHDGWWRMIDKYYPEDDIYIGIRIDIRDIKKAELDAKAAARSKTEFLANISHEIRTPMNGVMGMTELLLSSELTPRQTDFVNMISRSGHALLTIINDILDFSKAESGQIELESVPFNLRNCIEDVTTLLASTITETGLDLLVRIQPDIPSTFIGDVGRIRQILTNIVGNAVKFTHEGHVLIDVSGDILADKASLKIQVIDTGIGIPTDKLHHVFGKFNQADSSTTRQYGGTGLGLAISQQLTELMGGSISVTSEVGTGTNFSITLSLPVSEEVAVQKRPEQNIAGSNILIIDENAVNRDILTEQLRYWQCKTAAVKSSKLGLAVLHKAFEKKVKIDLVIVNYQMTAENGEDFCRKIRNRIEFADIPVIILSSVDAGNLHSRLETLNVSSFITKPVRSSVLHEAIAQAVDRPVVSTQQNASTSHEVVKDQSTHIEVSSPSNESKVNHVEVLIAEDNEVNQMYAGYVMEQLGLTYEIVPNGRIAVEKWKLLSPRIILMDISMPEMNGHEATQNIREIEKRTGLSRTPIIAVTAHSMKDHDLVCLESGMDEYLSKPLSIKTLQKCLETYGVVSEIPLEQIRA